MLWANQLIGALVRHKPYKRRPRTRAIGGLVESLPPLTPPLLPRVRDRVAPASASSALTTISRRAQSEHLSHSIRPQWPADSFSRPPVAL